MSGPESGAPAAPVRPIEPAATKMEYRPALDGVRALAVYLVVAFHAELTPLSGGFLGVDIFFVLSGYLVTRLIVVDLAGGGFRLGDFYNRRVRRLLPAALFVLAVVTLTWLLLASPVDRTAVLPDIRSAALYFSNWHFAAQATDYFAQNDNPSPVLHFWSLSVEEQFYVVWPLLVVIVWKLSRSVVKRAAGRLFALALVLAGGSLVSLWWTLATDQSDLAYYGTHARVYQLLGGAALAIGVQVWRWAERDTVLSRFAPAIQVVAVVGLLALATSWLPMDPSVRGVFTAVGALLLLLTLEMRPSAPIARVFSLPWPVYLGQISYGTYLWHFPVTVLIRRYVEIRPSLVAVVAAGVSTALAALSQRLLELPIRRSKVLGRWRWSVVTTGLVVSVAAGAVLFPALLRSSAPPVVQPASGQASAALPDAARVPLAGIDLTRAATITPGSPAAGPLPRDPTCTTVPLAECLIVKGSPTGRRVLLMGDSHALMLVPAFRAIAKQLGLTVAVAATTGCPWQRGLMFVRDDRARCTQVKNAWYDTVVPEFKPDLIVLVSRATDHAVGSEYAVASMDPAITGRDPSVLMTRTTEKSLAALAAPGRQLALVEPVPVDPVNTASCLSGARFADQCAFVTDGASPAERAYRGFGASIPGVTDVDIDPLVCPRLPVCDALLSGVVVRKDHDHITEAWSALIAPQLADLLRRDKLL